MTSLDLPLSPARRPSVLQRIAAYSASRGVTEGLLGLRGVLLATRAGSGGLRRLGTAPTFDALRVLRRAWCVSRPGAGAARRPPSR